MGFQARMVYAVSLEGSPYKEWVGAGCGIRSLPPSPSMTAGVEFYGWCVFRGGVMVPGTPWDGVLEQEGSLRGSSTPRITKRAGVGMG